MDESSQFCNVCGASSPSNAKFCPNCGRPIQISLPSTPPSPISSTPPASASASPSQESSSGCGKLVGIVFIALIVFAAWNNISHRNSPGSLPTSQSTSQGDTTIPGQLTPEPTLPFSIAPDDICHAYDAWKYEDPYYNDRCRQAMQREHQILANGVTASSYQSYRQYYLEEETAENNRAHLAHNICSEYGLGPNDPNCPAYVAGAWRT